MLMGSGRKNRSDEPEPPQQARPRASVKQRPAAAPFGAWLALPLLKHRGEPAFGRFAEDSCLCSRIVRIVNGPESGPVVPLVVFSVVQGSMCGSGTVPKAVRD